MKFYNSVDRAPALEPGEVVWANVLNPLENTKSRNKPRPAILLRRQGNGWRVMGLTTNPTYADGRSRVPVADPEALGLHGPTFFWGRPTTICSIDVLDHSGWIDELTANTLAHDHPSECTSDVLLGESINALSSAA